MEGFLPYIIFGAVILLFVLLVIFAKRRRASAPDVYELNRAFLTPREASFFAVLQPIAAKYGLHVFAKPRIADFVNVTVKRYEKGSDFYTHFNKISCKHIDFLLCDRKFVPVTGIEVDDKSHAAPDRVARDNFVNGLYENIGLPVLRVSGRPNPARIEMFISEVCG
ncbi:MAG: DUF2726 domain-containing protein [Defluviitaleaceae bacterium]|nr:DUF2726 domain-containing protein [Defluviitaleaceae bacterium]